MPPIINDVTIDPAALVHVNPAHATAQDIKLREVVIPAIDPISGKTVAKLMQALCSEGYGDEIPFGGGAAADPGLAVVTLGANSEGSETESLTTWTAGGTNGLAEWYVRRVFYDNTSLSPAIYAFIGLRIYDNQGRLYSVGREYKIEVERPVKFE